MPPETEKRRSKRFQMSLSAKLHVKDSEEAVQTKDVSTGGIFLYTGTELAEGSEVEIVLVLPSEVTLAGPQWVCCSARVVRVEEPTDTGKRGVAAAIEKIAVLPEL